MPSLLEKIESNAAKRLSIPPNRQPTQELTRYKNFLKWENHRLKMLHRSGSSGREVCQARAAMFDVLLRYLFDAVRSHLHFGSQKPSTALAVVALGGYGRGELNPQSDIDIMFLHGGEMVSAGRPNPAMATLTDNFLYTLWDTGLKVGHSVRSIDDCVKIANTEVQSKTSLIEARLVAGDQPLFERMQATVLAKSVRGFEKEYIEARLQDQAQRRARFGNSACLQEPNIKNGCGSLRDYQNLLWMAFFRYRVRSLQELQDSDFISRQEWKALDEAYDFLLRIRTELHYQVNRPLDVLQRPLQPAVALQVGYSDRSPRSRVEHFMRDLYTHMRNIHLITRTLEQRLALVPSSDGSFSIRGLIRRARPKTGAQTVDGFQVLDGQLVAGSNRVFREQPRRLMRAFLHAQQRNLQLHPDLAQLIRNQLYLADRSFRNDSHIQETFLEIINQRGNVAAVLRSMHEVGLLGKYIPEFGRLTCLVQHEFYHQYAADEHTLVCIEKLDQIWEADQPPYRHYTQLFQSLERPFILYLALLLHDSGKAYHTGNHAEVGRRLALRVAKRLGLDSPTTESLCLLIEHHLAMAQISQRRDLDDPDVITGFAQQIQSPENLVMLTLHTLADSTATSDQLWNGFKDSLLWTLHQKTLEVLTGKADYQRAEAKQRASLVRAVRRILPRTISDEEFDAHFRNLPRRYFQVHGPRQVAGHITLAHRFMHLQLEEEEHALEPVVHWHNEPDRGFTSVTICTWDRAGLFSEIAGSLTAAGLNILSAQIHTRTDGIILDTFFVTDARTGLLANRKERETFEATLARALTRGADLNALIAKQRATTRRVRPPAGERIETFVTFDNETSSDFTILEIESEDRVGLLYAISQTLAEFHLDIALAKVATEKGAAIDTFYVRQNRSSKILGLDQQTLIARQLKATISHLQNA